MLSQTIRNRLQQLNRAALPATDDSTTNDSAANVSTENVAEPIAATQLPHRVLAGEEVTNSSGSHLRLAASLTDLWPRGVQGVEAGQAQLANLLVGEASLHAELAAFARAFPRRTLYLDLETCGFAGSALFLIGLVRHDGASLVIEQLLARNYAEERAVLETLWRLAADCEVLVTFNGKSFDWPMVHDRSTRHHLGRDDRYAQRTVGPPYAGNCPPPLGPHDPRPELVHFDLLHHARRRWRRQLPNCRLQTLEWFLCGRRRNGDIAGSRIPGAYHEFVRTGRKDELKAILHHNVLDLVTLVELTLKLAE